MNLNAILSFLILFSVSVNGDNVNSSLTERAEEDIYIKLKSIGNVHLATGNYDDSFTTFRESLNASPDKLWTYLSLVESMVAKGDFEISFWRSLLKEMENSVMNYLRIQNFKVDLESLSPDKIIGDSSTTLALALAAEEAHDFEKSFGYFKALKNYEKRKHKSYDAQLVIDQARGIKQYFSSSFWPSEDEQVGIDSKVPIFIIGMPYSGSKILEVLLDGHSRIFGLNANPRYFEIVSDKVGYALKQGLFEPRIGEFQKYVTESKSGVSEDSAKETLRTAAMKSVKDMLMIAKYITGTSDGQILHYLDTSLENYRLLGFIHYIYPEAVVINVVRDPMDTLLDCYRDRSDEMSSNANKVWSMDIEHLSTQYISYLQLMAHWRSVLPGKIIDIHSAALISDPETTLQPVFDALGLTWENLPEGITTRIASLLGPEGYWVNYADELSDLTSILSPTMSKFQDLDMLPFADEINWTLDSDYDYPKASKRETIKRDFTALRPPAEKKIGSTASSTTKSSSTNGSKKTENTKNQNQASQNSHKLDSSKNPKPVNADSAAVNPALKKLYDQVVNPSDISMIKSMSNQLPYLSGDSLIDEIITAAFIQARTSPGRAEDVFKSVLRIRGDLPSARLGLGSILMNAQRVVEAVEVFSEMIRMNSTCGEGYRKRAEAYTAIGQLDEALDDYNLALEINPEDSETLIARARYFIKTRYFHRAHEDLQRSIQIAPSPYAYYYLGQTEIQFAHIGKAISYYDKALAIDATLKEIYLQKAHAQMEGARWRDGFETLKTAIAMDPTNRYTYSFRGLLSHNIGRPKAALKDFKKALDLEPRDVQVMNLMAVCLQSIGRHAEAIEMQSKMLALLPEHKVWYGREINAFWWLHLDDHFSSFNLDNDVHSDVRSGWLNEKFSNEGVDTNYTSLVTLLPPTPPPPPSASSSASSKLVVSESGLRLLSLTADLGRWVQLDCEGFMPNVRQHRMFGLAVLEMAQALRRHVRLLGGGRGGGLQVTDKSSSRSADKHSASSKKGCKEGYHRFGYRDLLDIAVRWRQISEPMDCVLWFDRLPIDESGYSLVTHMVNGEMELLRYFTYYPWGFNITKAQMMVDYFVGNNTPTIKPTKPTSAQKAMIQKATDLRGLYNAVNESLWVIAPIKGIAKKGKVLDGTRVVLTASPPDGFAFTIRTPNSLSRFDSFEIELEAAFDRLVNELVKKNPDKKVVAKHGLELFYYWANVAALTRGTAATGYAVLLACIVAGGHMVGDRMPRQRQLDWEAIFTTEPSLFLANSGASWVQNLVPLPFPKEVLEGSSDSYLVSEVFGTPAKALAAIGKLLEDESVEEEYPFVHNGEVVDKTSFWNK